MTKLVNRAKMTTASTGTGSPITLGSAVDGYQTFADAGVANGDVVRYVIEDGDAWEIGTGTYTASGTTLSRTVVESSNADAALNLTGNATVFVTAAAADILQPGDNISSLTNDAGYTTNIGDITGVTAGNGLTGGGASGSVTLAVGAGGGITVAADTVSHADTSSQSSVNNSGRTFIQDITLDTYGHVTGIVSATDADTFTGTVTSVATGGGLTGGTITTSGTISHADTSSQGSVNNSDATVIQDVTLDTYGHITALGSATITPALIGAATSAQGALADSATQPGDNISTLTNDAGYTTNIGDITAVTAGSGLTGGGTSGSVTLNVGAGGGITVAADTVSHADTSSQASVSNSGATVIQDVTLDTYGHVTGLGSATLGLSDFGVTATATELNTLDGFAGTTDNLNATQFLTGRNKIINGNFDVWQRGTSVTGSGYIADRWLHNVASGSSGTVTQSRQAFSPGQTDVPNEPTYFYRIQGSSYTFTAANVTQSIEDVRTFAGQTVTVSFYAKASAARQIRVRLDQIFNSSASVGTSGSALSLTTSWQKFTATIAVPSISGKTVGSNSSLRVIFDIKEGAFGSDLGNDSIDIAQVQLEAGDVATPFEVRPIGQELALCQRYYTKIGGENLADIYGAGYITGSGFILDTLTLPVKMRVPPTVTKVGTWNVTNVQQPAIIHVSSTTFVLYASGTLVGQAVYYNPASTGYLTFDAEL